MTEKNNYTVWVLDDDKAIGWILEQALSKAGFNVRYFERPSVFKHQLEKQVPDIIFSDIRMPEMDGFQVLNHVYENYPHLPVIIMTAFTGIDPAALAYQKGAFDFLAKPFDIDEVVRLANKAIQLNARKEEMPPRIKPSSNFIGSSPSIQKIFSTIGRLSTTHVNVLITGESGTGKELVAQALHQYSPRKNKPLIALNIAAIPTSLIEAELFGHEKGAFTGAIEQKKGRFEQAHDGTLFLDEIGDMPQDTQTRLLRVIATGEFYRVGGTVPIHTNARIITATHQDLQAMVKNGTFREDLFHRLNIINIHCPPLRDRKQDIPELCRSFLQEMSLELKRPAVSLHADAESIFMRYAWPGNIRELKNLCQRLCIMVSGKEIHGHDIPEDIRAVVEKISAQSQDVPSKFQEICRQYGRELLKNNVSDVYRVMNASLERILIETALKTARGHKQKAAKLLGWGRNTLTRKIREHHLEEGSNE